MRIFCVALNRGQTLIDHAIDTGRSRETVKWRAKKIFGLVGVGSQQELVARLKDLI